MFVALFITDQRGSPNGRYGVVVMVSLSWCRCHGLIPMLCIVSVIKMLDECVNVVIATNSSSNVSMFT